MSHRRPLKIRQWLPLVALALGLVGSAIGERVGQPNSWLWFAGGVTAAVLFTIVRYSPRGNAR